MASDEEFFELTKLPLAQALANQYHGGVHSLIHSCPCMHLAVDACIVIRDRFGVKIEEWELK